jgi:hypothetical protein
MNGPWEPRVDRTVPWDDPEVVGGGPGPAFVVTVGGHAVTMRDRDGHRFWLAYASKAGAENAAVRARAAFDESDVAVRVRCYDPTNRDEEDYR